MVLNKAQATPIKETMTININLGLTNVNDWVFLYLWCYIML